MIRAVTAFAFLAVSTPTLSFEVGETVVVIGEAHLNIDGQIGDKVDPGLTLRIGAIDGNLLWVGNHHPGWLESEHVVSLDQAAPKLTELIRNSPQKAPLYSGRAMVWLARNEHGKAIADCNQAIRFDPDCVLAYDVRGLAWHRKGDFDNAIADFDEVLRRDPNNVSAYLHRADVWKSMGAREKVLADFSNAVQLDPKNVLLYQSRGVFWMLMGEIEKTISDYDKAIELDPKAAPTYCNRGVAECLKGDYDKAIADLNEAARLDPKLAPVYSSRGHTWGMMGEYEKSIADLSEFIRLEPYYAMGYNNLAWLYATCPDGQYRDGKLAIANATKACELNRWQNPICFATLAAAYAEGGDWDNATKYQRRAIELTRSPVDKQAGQDRLKLYEQMQPYHEKPKDGE